MVRPSMVDLQPNMREDSPMDTVLSHPIRIMRIIARMNIGGPAVQVSGLMRGFDKNLFDQRLYTGFCSLEEADYLENVAKDISAVRIDGFGRRVNLIGDLKAFIFLTREIREFKPHIIHTHTAKAGFLGRIASIASGHPSIRVHTFHGHLLNGYFNVVKKTLVVMAEKVLALFTSHLLAVGEQVRQDLLDAGVGHKNRFGLMPPGLSIGALWDHEYSKDYFGLKKEKLQCSFIGRITQIKRPDRFLDVVSEVQRRGLDVDFFMAGNGELFQMCQDRIALESLNVKVLGWQGNIERVLSASDMVLLTSDNEGTPLSLIQAGMAGLPVVTTRVGSVPEIVIDGKTGIITDLEVNELANAIERLVNDSDLRARMGSAARKFTMANFGVKRLVNDHQNLYVKLIANQASS